LPAQLTRFIGRKVALQALTAALGAGDVRVLTLTGPGGVGKTRLALQVAAELSEAFNGAVAFVPLGAVNDPALVLPAIAQTLAIDESLSLSMVDQLGAALENRKVLLLLDNLEQITAAGPSLVALLNRCAGLSLLVTSRIPLHITGERTVRVPPLEVPKENGALGNGLDHALACVESVALLLDRAATAHLPLDFTASSASDIVAICQQTDGLPLAIELAAARLRVLTPYQLAARLDAPLHLLDDGPVDQPERLQSMRQAIAWSYQLLTPDQQTLLKWLSVFAGGFGIAAVEAMANAIPTRSPDGPTALSDLTTFVDASLVHRLEDIAGESRFALLETIRAFGLEQLALSGESDRARRAHVTWCISFAEPASAALAGPDHVLWWNRMAAEIGNIRAAFAWIFAQDDASLAIRLSIAMSWFWSAPAFHEEARGIMRRVVEMPGVREKPAELAAALGVAAGMEHWALDLDRASELLDEQIALYRALSDRPGVISALRAMGSVAIDRDDLATAIHVLSEARDLASLEEPTWDRAAISNLLGIVAFSRAEYAAAATLSGEAATEWAAMDDIGHVAAARINQARALVELGDLDRSAECLRSVLALIDVEVGDDAMVVFCCEIAAAMAVDAGNATAGARLLGAALAMTDRLGHFQRPAFALFRDRLRAMIEIVLGDAAAVREIERGAALPLGEVIEVARNVVARTSQDELGQRPRPPAADVLTPREREVLQLVVDGLSDKEIAVALGMARNTASIHVGRLREKLGAPSRTALAALAIRQHLV
jgi:predicted ATPase/DNA-binding CsgD family transcriptional regulator